MKREQDASREEPAEKSSHKHVAGSTQGQTKAKTKPLESKNEKVKDEEEGNMNNGEIGNDLKK